MNDSNHWEKVLQSWKPRPASAEIRKRLFTPAELSPALQSRRMLAWLWYAPAAVCVFLAAALLSAGTDSHVIGLIACATSNPTMTSGHFDMPSLPVASAGQQNNIWSVATFDWTKATSCVSTTGSFPPWKTNIQKL